MMADLGMTEAQIDAYLESLQAADMEADERLEAEQRQIDTPNHYFHVCAAQAAEALSGWITWHADRGEARGLPELPALEEVSDAAAAIRLAIEEGAEDQIIADASEALHCAISAAKHTAEEMQRDFDVATEISRYCSQHAEEIETSYLRGWGNILSSVAHCYCMARIEPDQAFKWCHQATHELAFCSPPSPGSNF